MNRQCAATLVPLVKVESEVVKLEGIYLWFLKAAEARQVTVRHASGLRQQFNKLLVFPPADSGIVRRDVRQRCAI